MWVVGVDEKEEVIFIGDKSLLDENMDFWRCKKDV